MAVVELRYDPKDTAWFTANATLVLKAGEPAYHETTGLFKLGDGVTDLQTLPFLPATGGGGGGGGVPYTGATGDVNLGEYQIKVGQIELDQSPTGTAGIAITRWNDTHGIAETTLKGGNVVIKNGIDLVARVVNKVTPNTTLSKSHYQVVKISGAQGQRLAVGLAQANNDNNSADTLGIAIETIATNQEGFIMCVGQIEDINTTGISQGETWNDGDVLYLSPTTPGAITKVKPTGLTGHIVVIGYVEYAHAIHGKIYVKIMNGWELSELHDTYINNPLNNDVLTYNGTSSLWENQKFVTLASGLVPYTGANANVDLGSYRLSSKGATINVASDNLLALGLSNAEALRINGADLKTQVYGGGGINYPSLTFNSMTTYGLSCAFSGYRIGIVANSSMVAGFNNSEATFTPLAATTGAVTSFNITPSANTGQTASTNIPSFKITGNTKTWSTGAITNQYFSYLSSNTIAFAGASTVTNAFNLYVDEVTAGVNATITNNYGIGTTNLYIKSRTTASSNKALHVRNTGNTADLFYVRGDGYTFIGDLQIGNGFGLGTLQVYGAQGASSDIVKFFNSTGANAIYEFRQSNNHALLYLKNSSAAIGVLLTGETGASNYINGVFTVGSTSSVASAAMNIDSTTKGFLPPRMTTTQKNAISTPAAGLIVYDTTTNKACCYDGSTWNDLF